MYISIFAFSSFAHRKLKLGQNYQSTNKKNLTWIRLLSSLSVWSLFAACVCAFLRAYLSGHYVWCLEKSPVKARAR